MRLSRIQATNFLSYKTIDIEFPKSSNIIGIVGDNGSGKSSFLETIPWGLYGKTNRNSLEKHIPNIQDPKKSKVTITLDEDFIVERQKNPPVFSFTTNNVLKRSNTISETQKLFDHELNCSYNQFSASNYFDDILNSAFLSLALEEKRKVVGQYFDLEDFFKLRKQIKVHSEDCKKNLEQYQFLSQYNYPNIINLIKLETEKKLYYDFWVKALADEGIIKNNLAPLFQTLSDKINKYLKFLFDEQIFLSISPVYEIYLNISGMELGIKSVSSSQCKRLNLAVMLALSELHKELKHPKLSNLLVFDELSGLDLDSKEKLSTLIKELGKTNQIFVVTHDKELLKLIDPVVLKVSYKDKISSMEFL